MRRLTSSGCRLTSKPPTTARPEVGAISPHSTRMVVDLPAPLGPRKPKISPGWTSKFRSATAVKSPKRLVSFSMWTAGPEVLGSMCQFLPAHQRDKNIFERGLNLLVFERRDGEQLFGRCDGRVNKQVQIDTHRLHSQDAGLMLQSIAGGAMIVGCQTVSCFRQATFQASGSIHLNQTALVHKAHAVGALGFV